MDALSIPKAVLAGYDWGGRAACIIAALWPERVACLLSCGAGYNIQDIDNALKPVSPEKERRAWYYYLNSERGRQALVEHREGQRHRFPRRAPTERHGVSCEGSKVKLALE